MRDIVRSLPDDLRTLAQHGSRRFGELYELVHRREASRPNALWQADHTQLDIILLREDGAAARPWLTNGAIPSVVVRSGPLAPSLARGTAHPISEIKQFHFSFTRDARLPASVLHNVSFWGIRHDAANQDFAHQTTAQLA